MNNAMEFEANSTRFESRSEHRLWDTGTSSRRVPKKGETRVLDPTVSHHAFLLIRYCNGLYIADFFKPNEIMALI